MTSGRNSSEFRHILERMPISRETQPQRTPPHGPVAEFVRIHGSRETGGRTLTSSAGFSSDGKTLGISTSDLANQRAEIVFLDVELGRQKDEWPLARVKTRSLAHTPDWRTVYQGAEDHKIHVNRRGRPETVRLPGHAPAEAWGLAFSPDGKRLISGGDDANNSLDPLTEIASHQAHSKVDPKIADVVALAFTPDGKTLASGGIDGTVRLWHVDTRQELLRFDGMPAQVNHLAFSPDGLTLAAALHNGEIWLWQAK
jgi:WD40 repeat protein